MNVIPIPDKQLEQWKNLVNGDTPHEFSNFVLQMKVEEARQAVARGAKTPEEAVGELHELCSRYQRAVQRDLKEIFGIE